MSEKKQAGDGVTDEQMVEQVTGQTDSELEWQDVFKREADGASSDTEVAKADADEIAGD